jgi:serine-type D-Ala-D-Ala carboxypeptidase/endopeptidase (penicillin-binding protein 4)
MRKIAQILLTSLFFLPQFLSAQALNNVQKAALDKLVLQSPVFARHFYGFMLYDPNGKVTLMQKDADKFFTPASNTKIMTLYTALRVLRDSMPVLRYARQGAFTIVQGQGNPVFLNPMFPQDTMAITFLRRAKGALAFSAHNFKDGRFGDGWAWNDFTESYQPEKGSMPMYGNLVDFRIDSSRKEWQVKPTFFLPSLEFDPTNTSSSAQVVRDEDGQHFRYNTAALRRARFSTTAPFNYSDHLICELLTDTLRRKVQLWAQAPSTSDWKTLSMPMQDSMLRVFMQDSDNFLAEQLLLMSAAKQFGELNTEKIIEYSKSALLSGPPEGMVWVDGSGLSRYNLFAPKTIVKVLERLYLEQGTNRLFSIFPAGGVNGTIKDWYAGKDGKPYVFAKTGTLSNNHNLSGYIRTNKGRILIFSFMHNHYLGGATPIRREMQKVMEWIRDNL